MPYTPTAAISADELESIHVASLQVLAEIGMDFLDADARELLRAAGAETSPDDQRVRFDPAMVEERIATAPMSFTLHARNPERHLRLGDAWMAFGTVGSPPNVADLDRGRRIGNREDYQNLLRLGQSLNSVHFLAGYPVEPVDLHHGVRYLHATHDALTLMDKAIHCYSLGRQRNIDVLEMVRIARGVDDATLDLEPSVFTVVNSSSPLRLDAPMLQGILAFAERNQVIVHHAVHAERGDGAGDPCRRAGRAERRGAGRDGPDPGRPTRAHRSSTAGSRPTSTCSRARRRSGRRSTCGPRWSAASWRAATGCPTGPPTSAPPTPSTRRRPTSASSRCGARSWAGSTC